MMIILHSLISALCELAIPVYTGLHLFAKQVAKALESVVECTRIGVAVIGLEVPHAHIHLCPMDSLADLDFTKPRAVLSKEEFARLSSKIAAAYETQQ